MFDLRLTLAVGLGAAIGAITRLLITQAVVARAGAPYGPYATFFINVTGSFLIGVVAETAATRAGFPPALRTFLTTGIIGGYTTFSAFSLEALGLGTRDSLLAAGTYVIGSVGFGIAATFGGIATVRALAH